MATTSPKIWMKETDRLIEAAGVAYLCLDGFDGGIGLPVDGEGVG